MKRILIVCTGNICRSPMAEGLLRERLRRHQLSDKVIVASRGTFALDGRPASHFSVAVLADHGIDLTDHVAATITPDEVRTSDLILVMTEEHRRSVFHLAPQYLYKVLLLSELSGEHFDVADPYTQPREMYERTYETIQWCIDNGWETLVRRLNLDLSS